MDEARLDEELKQAMGEPVTAASGHIDDGVLIRYRSGLLEEAVVNDVDDHLAECQDCRDLLRALARPVEDQERRRAEAVLLPRRRRALWAGAGAVLAAAAAVVLFVSRPIGTGEAFPTYSIDGPHGLVKIHRSDDTPTTDRLAPNGRIRLRLLPDEATDQNLVAAVFAEHEGLLERVDAHIEQRRGVFAIEADARVMFGERFGPRRFHVVVGRLASLLDSMDGAPAGALTRVDGKLWTFDVQYEDVHDP